MKQQALFSLKNNTKKKYRLLQHCLTFSGLKNTTHKSRNR